MRKGEPRGETPPPSPAAPCDVRPNQELPHGRSGCGGGTSGCGPGAFSAAAPGPAVLGPAGRAAPAAPAVMSVLRPPQPALPAALLLLLLALGARASDVVELTDADFESGLAERPGLVLVEFFAPW